MVGYTSKTNLRTIFFFLIMIPFFKPIGLATIPLCNRVYQIWKMLSMLGMASLLARRRSIWKVMWNHVEIIGFMLFGLIYVFNCLRFHTPVVDLVNNLITDFMLFIFVLGVISSSHAVIENYLCALRFLFSLLIFLQVVSVVLVRNSIIEFSIIEDDYYYLFGTDNYSAFTLVPMIVVVMYIDTLLEQTRGKISYTTIILYVMLSLSYLYMHSIAAAGSCLILGLFLVVTKSKHMLLRLINAKSMLALGAIMLVLILKFDFHNLFAAFIADQLGKGEIKALTLNSRTIIWSDAVDLILRKPIFGWGELSQKAIDDYVLYGVEHAHNILLELWMRTGIVGATSYIVFLLAPFKHDSKWLHKSRARILAIGMLSYIALCMLDAYPTMQCQYVLLALLYGWRELEVKFIPRLRVLK